MVFRDYLSVIQEYNPELMFQRLVNSYWLLLAIVLYSSSNKHNNITAMRIMPSSTFSLWNLMPVQFWRLAIANQINAFFNLLFSLETTFIISNIILFHTDITHLLQGILIVGIITFITINLYVTTIITSLLSINKLIRVCMRVLSFIMIGFVISSILLKINLLVWPYSLQYVLAQLSLTIVNGKSDGFLALSVYVEAIVYCSIIISINFYLGRKIKPTDVYDSIIGSIEKTRYSYLFSKIQRYLFIFPKPIRLIISKEITQIIEERVYLVQSMVYSLLLMVVIVGANIIKREVFLTELGIIIGISQIAFVLGMSLLSREGKEAWIVQLNYPNLWKITLYKAMACYVISILCGLLIYMAYVLICMVIFNISGVLILKLFFKGILIAQPAAIGLGFIIGGLIPYGTKGEGKEIYYNFRSLEGLLFLFQICLVSVPATFVCGTILEDYYIITPLYIIYMLFLLWLGFVLTKRRLQLE